jgi:predicted dehydrogenase
VSKVRWGVLGTSKFAQTKFIPAMKHCRSGEITAIASRDLAGARAAADRLGIAKAYGSYEELLADAGPSHHPARPFLEKRFQTFAANQFTPVTR